MIPRERLSKGLITTVIIIIINFFALSAKGYLIGNLNLSSFTKDKLPTYLEQSKWYVVKISKDELILKMMTLEPVVRRCEFITHEAITVRYYPEKKYEAENVKKGINYIQDKGKLVSLLGLMLQKFSREGFEVGGNSSFIKIAGVESYRFELLRSKISSQQLLKGYLPVKYAWHIVIWKEGWYTVTYYNLDSASPGPHFSDFGMLLKDIEFTSK